MDAQEPIDDPHEIHFASLRKEATEEVLHCGIFREVNEVIESTEASSKSLMRERN